MGKKKLPASVNWRINFILGLFLLIGGLIGWRFFYLQVLHHKTYFLQAQAQHQNKTEIKSQRGKIYLKDKDEKNYFLATNREYYNLFAVPRELDNLKDRSEVIADIAETLARITGLAQDATAQKLSKTGDPYEPLFEKLSDAQYQEIRERDFPGLHFVKEWKRWYPQETLAAHVLGFLGRDEERGEIGQYGVEGYYQDTLAGAAGASVDSYDASGNWTGVPSEFFSPARDGDDIYLTLDQNIQFMIDKSLREIMEKWEAAGASAIVMDPKTGAILGMASEPSFNPNEYAKAPNLDVFLNPIIQNAYEPGSIFKPITMSSAIDSGAVTPQTTYEDTGSLLIGGHVITNAANRAFGLSTMTNVLEKSINTGIVFAQRKMEKDEFKGYIESFNLGRRLGIDLAGEVPGNIANLKYKRDIDYATIAFGQGIAVTPLQIVSAVSAIANGGAIMRPFLVEKTVSSEGEEKKTEVKEAARPISAQTASTLTAMMVSTVENGYDKIKVDGYYVAGKTGTAQMPDPEKGGYLDQYVHSFVGFAPAYDPAFIVLLKLDTPRGVRFASSSLAPV